MKYVEEIYYNTIDMVINTRALLKNIFAEVEDIEEKPACFHHLPPMGGLDYLVTDFQMLLDLILKSLQSRVIYDHAKYNILFELAHSLYSLLKLFRFRYISCVYKEF